MTKKKEKEYNIISADEYVEYDMGVSLGNPKLDRLIGGMIPIGKQVEIYGKWSTGKTVLLWTILREAQKMGAYTLLAEAEDAFNKKFAAACGLDLKKLKMLVGDKESPLTVPRFFEVAETKLKEAQRHYEFSVTGLDSLAALNSAMRVKDGKESYDKQYMSDVARQMTQGLNRLKGLLRPWKGILVIVNQVRDNVGVLYGNKITTPGGNAVKFHSDLRLQLYSPKRVDANTAEIGIYVSKSRLAPPFQRAKFRIHFDSGLDPKYGTEEKEEDDALAIEEG